MAGNPRWHAIRAAHPGGLVVYRCLLSSDYTPVCIATSPPMDLRCPACERETTREVDARFDRSEVLELESIGDWMIEPTHGGEGK